MMKSINIPICIAVLLGVVPFVPLFAAGQVRPEVSDPAEIEALVTALGDFVKRTPPILKSARLNGEEKLALKVAIDQGTQLLEKTPNVEQKYWAAEFLVKARLTLARVQPPTSVAELQKIEELIAVLEKTPEKVEFLPEAKFHVLRHSIVLLARPGNDMPNPYSVKESVKKYIAENPKSLDFFGKTLVDVAIQYAVHDRQFTIDTIRDVVELYKNSEFSGDRAYVGRLQRMAKRFEMIGHPITFSGVDLGGNKISSTDFKNKIVLIDFWETSCTPCLVAIPELKRLHGAYNKRGFEIVGVSVDKYKDVLERFLEERKLPWKTLSDTATAEKGGIRLSEYFSVAEYPTLMLVGRDGKLIATDFDLKTLERELVKQFNNNPPKTSSAMMRPIENTSLVTPSLF